MSSVARRHRLRNLRGAMPTRFSTRAYISTRPTRIVTWAMARASIYPPGHTKRLQHALHRNVARIGQPQPPRYGGCDLATALYPLRRRVPTLDGQAGSYPRAEGLFKALYATSLDPVVGDAVGLHAGPQPNLKPTAFIPYKRPSGQ